MKTYKLFGLTILEIFEDKEELPVKAPKNPEGAVLDVSPEELEREKDKETIRKMEGKECI